MVRDVSKGFLRTGDPYGEVRDAWSAKESVRDIYHIRRSATGSRVHPPAVGECSRTGHSHRKVHRLGRTIARWATQITNWHHSSVTNGPTEGLNNLTRADQTSSVRLCATSPTTEM